MTIEAEVGVMYRPEPKNEGNLPKLEKAGNRFSPRASRGKQTCPPILDFLTSGIVR